LSSTVTLLSLHWLKFTCMAVTNFKGSWEMWSCGEPETKWKYRFQGVARSFSHNTHICLWHIGVAYVTSLREQWKSVKLEIWWKWRAKWRLVGSTYYAVISRTSLTQSKPFPRSERWHFLLWRLCP
jgi:hypothetical protein